MCGVLCLRGHGQAFGMEASASLRDLPALFLRDWNLPRIYPQPHLHLSWFFLPFLRLQLFAAMATPNARNGALKPSSSNPPPIFP